VFQYIYEKVPADALVVVANSDIFLDDSWRLLWSLSMRDTFLSLLRWDVQENPAEKPVLFGPRSDSQDTWVVSSNSVKERKWNWDSLDISFGQNGCDNAINVEMLRNKYMVANPCMSLITNHVHMSGVRTYEDLDILYRPIFMYLKPTGIHDLKPEYALGEKVFETIEVPIRQPPIRCPNPAVFRTMLCKQEEAFQKTGVVFPSHTVRLHTYDNAFETRVSGDITYRFNTPKSTVPSVGNNDLIAALSKPLPNRDVRVIGRSTTTAAAAAAPALLVCNVGGNINVNRSEPLAAWDLTGFLPASAASYYSSATTSWLANLGGGVFKCVP
jgi:hypothetical protein